MESRSTIKTHRRHVCPRRARDCEDSSIPIGFAVVAHPSNVIAIPEHVSRCTVPGERFAYQKSVAVRTNAERGDREHEQERTSKANVRIPATVAWTSSDWLVRILRYSNASRTALRSMGALQVLAETFA